MNKRFVLLSFLMCFGLMAQARLTFRRRKGMTDGSAKWKKVKRLVQI